MTLTTIRGCFAMRPFLKRDAANPRKWIYHHLSCEQETMQTPPFLISLYRLKEHTPSFCKADGAQARPAAAPAAQESRHSHPTADFFFCRLRYHGEYLRTLKACLDFHRHGLLLLICGAAYSLLSKESGLPLCLYMSLMCLCQLLTIAFGLQNPSAAEISEISERNNLNVAHGLAWSYYIGYLKIILPRLKDSISIFNETNNFLLKCKKTRKLHILIPLNCHVPDNLLTADSRIQFINNLPEVAVDRAGIKRRSYKNSVYGVLDENQKMHFCVVEYATPLQSLNIMSQDENAALSSQARLEQAKLFCRTLEEILENSKECSGCYQLIVYDGENGEHFLSKEILRHLKQQDQEEYAMCTREEGPFCRQTRMPVEETELLLSSCDQPLSLRSDSC
ncbi:stimulator of interferon genes protein isoform X2 [Paroedura picta]|uniref:stimulator of interferon genes protein isoform X2 n=2 Tax=Paroedura picta TaxID=143630 RepID=UPI0040561D49